ncbi:hypothetical protein EW146_g4126 [Bondarzewia mesenterica]|uniref:Uncharacterized protein n=1 Tax=Bondarzewia mesenterica TaxID=1095465 RepID=A0A4S4LXM6_9AGAM|nr:hypothetical protein EW146_g4126 [Bondarzewia mesenterica]
MLVVRAIHDIYMKLLIILKDDPYSSGFPSNHLRAHISCNASLAGTSPGAIAYKSDPILRYRPRFAHSVPVQILMTGIILTLVMVLFMHLIFTAQYHWRLAQANYVLQISAVITLLTSLIATLILIFRSAIQESQQWPYMLSYVAVDVPPLTETDDSWSTAGIAAWLMMNATTSALIQITHIQFLTLLYPSRLEARLIFILLGPLAIVAAIMQLMAIQYSSSVVHIADAIRNVCNATLSLLFTASLLIWGTVVNRKQAWRTDGGTAAFGVGALTLALISTAITFAFISAKDQYDWVMPLTWAVMLWQSFLGWWWWVGAGMGVGEVEELLRREEKRKRKRRLREERRKEQKERAMVLWKDVTDKLTGKPKRLPSTEGENRLGPLTERTETLSTVIQPSMTLPEDAPLWRRVVWSSYSILRRGYLGLRQAHLLAARRQAEERAERINEVYGNEGAHEAPDRQPRIHGWGLGSFGLRVRGMRGATTAAERNKEHQEGSDGEGEGEDNGEKRQELKEQDNPGVRVSGSCEQMLMHSG